MSKGSAEEEAKINVSISECVVKAHCELRHTVTNNCPIGIAITVCTITIKVFKFWSSISIYTVKDRAPELSEFFAFLHTHQLHGTLPRRTHRSLVNLASFAKAKFTGSQTHYFVTNVVRHVDGRCP